MRNLASAKWTAGFMAAAALSLVVFLVSGCRPTEEPDPNGAVANGGRAPVQPIPAPETVPPADESAAEPSESPTASPAKAAEPAIPDAMPPQEPAETAPPLASQGSETRSTVERPGPPLSKPAVEKPAPAVPAPAAAVAPATVYRPVVVLSNEHAQMCRIGVGDKFPELSLPDVNAQPVATDGQRGEKLTVVVFWSLREALGREQFNRLQRETLEPYKSLGVNVIAINVGDETDRVRQAYQEAHAEFPCLLDGDRAAFTTIATGQLPRTYLLNGSGQILWMDLVYSSSTRRELTNAIHFFLGELRKTATPKEAGS
jgi:peroxiredoxin